MHLPLDPTDAQRAARAAAALQCVVDTTALSPAAPEFQRSIVDPATLGGAARERLIAELFAARLRLRTAGDELPQLPQLPDPSDRSRTFAASIIPANAVQTTLCVYRDPAGAVIGYLACHLHEVTVDAGPIRALRVATCLPAELPPASAATFFLKQATWALFRSRGKDLYFAQALSDPGAYAWLYRVADRIWPCPARETPSEVRLLRAQICGELGLAPTGDDPAIFAADPASASPEASRWRRHPRPEVHYFVGKNPAFDRGQGLFTLVPLTMGGLLRGTLRAATIRVGRGLHRPGRSRQLPALPSAPVRGRDKRRP